MIMSNYGLNTKYAVTITTGLLLGLMISGAVSQEVRKLPQPRPPTAVTINNKLFSGATLSVHCKSKENDLGRHFLAPGKGYKFSFHPNFFIATTLFFCKIEWPGNSHYIDAYDQKKDQDRCRRDCCWNIVPTGACDCHTGYCIPWHVKSLDR